MGGVCKITTQVVFPKDRSSLEKAFCTKGVVKNVTKFTGKHLCQSSFLIKSQASGLQLY